MAAGSKNFLDATESRRTYYQLTNESTISDARIKELVAHTIKHVPSAFNSQTTRMVVVLKEKHEELWDAIMEVYKVQLPADKFEHAKGRMVGFRKAYGTVSGGESPAHPFPLCCRMSQMLMCLSAQVLFYEDSSNVREFQEKYKTYEDKFPASARTPSSISPPLQCIR